LGSPRFNLERGLLLGQYYPYPQYGAKKNSPKHAHRWNVWNNGGACDALETREYVAWLAEKPEESYTIHFVNDSMAQTEPGNRLWELLKAIAVDYVVEVFPAELEEYRSWTGAETDSRAFDAISIELRKVEAAS
jgi:hypothetical protein